MKLGISLVPDGDPDTKPAPAYYDEVLQICEIADAGGLEWVKVTEYYLNPYGGYCPDPFAFLSAVAARTSRIRLMTGCAIPVFHHPVMFASRAAMLDALSHGRLDLGVARGYLPYEHDVFDIPMAESHERYEAAVLAVTRLLNETGVTEKTPYFSYENVTTLPRPVQQPIPLWSAAVRSERSFTRVAELGHGLLATPMFKPLELFRSHSALYRDAYAKAGHDAPSSVIASLPVFVARTDAEAIEVGDRLFQHFVDVWVRAADSWNGKESDSFDGYADMGRRLAGMSGPQWREFGSAIFGSPSTVVEKIKALHEGAGGFEGLVAQVDFGAVSGDIMERNVRLLVEEVAPALADL